MVSGAHRSATHGVWSGVDEPCVKTLCGARGTILSRTNTAWVARRTPTGWRLEARFLCLLSLRRQRK
jgi:hypothetical protein